MTVQWTLNNHGPSQADETLSFSKCQGMSGDDTCLADDSPCVHRDPNCDCPWSVPAPETQPPVYHLSPGMSGAGLWGLRPALTHQVRDCKRISKLPVLQLILPYEIGCISSSLEIPLLSLHQVAPRPSGATKAGPLPDICPSSPFSEYCILVCFGTMKARLIAVIGWNNERSREVSTMDVFARLSCRDAPSPIYTLRWYCNFWGFTLFY